MEELRKYGSANLYVFSVEYQGRERDDRSRKLTTLANFFMR